jgi:hypothetical protein
MSEKIRVLMIDDEERFCKTSAILLPETGRLRLGQTGIAVSATYNLLKNEIIILDRGSRPKKQRQSTAAQQAGEDA